MSKLLQYSIETDQTVLLNFSDEKEMRVPLSRLKEFVAPSELKKIENSVQLRENFFKRHLPKLAISFAAGGLLVASSFHENAALNNLFKPSSKVVQTPSAEQAKKDVLPIAQPSQPMKPVNTKQIEDSKQSTAIAFNATSELPKKHPRFEIHIPHIPKILP